MGLFTKRARQEPVVPNDAANGAGTATGNGVASRGRKRRAVAEPYSMATRPSFGQWLKYTWLDIMTMVILGVIGLGVYEAHPAPTRSFPVTFSDGEVVYPQFAYPLRDEIIPIWAAALLATLVPIAVILIVQIRVRSFWDVNNGVIGLLYSVICAAVFQVFLKWLIGGLRPHFLAVCKPDVSLSSNAAGVKGAGYNAAGFTNIYYTREICTGDTDEIDDSLESFPSGHTTAAFGGFVYLYLYLNAKLKVWANYHPAMWKLVAIYAPILGAVLIGGALTIDEFHNWYDVFAGAVIGTVMAFSAYRMVYASIWDWRINHIPLNRGQAFYPLEADLQDAVWTHKVGWGSGANFIDSPYGAGPGTGTGTGYGNGYNPGAGSMARKPVGGTGHGGVRGDDMV